jgi:bilirubin oxidase
MERRRFLTRLTQVSGLILAAKAWPAFASNGMGSSGMADTHGTGPMARMGQKGLPLAAHDAIPMGRPFVAPVVLPNETSEPGKFRARLIAAPADVSYLPGVTTQALAYNGQVPGPLIELHAGDSVEITLENRLNQPTTIHWHGLPVPPDQDGNPANMVAPGASRVYQFTLPDDVEGLYWYHPHPHEISAEQVYRGLAGPIIVRPKSDPLADIPERLLAVTDLRLTADGQIPADSMMDWMNGRVGQFALINGLNTPVLSFHSGGHERWRILNATNARYLRLTIPGHHFTLLGTDGGRIEYAQPDLQEILLAPAQRVEILVAASGRDEARLVAASYDQGKMGGAGVTPVVDLMRVDFSGVRQVPQLKLVQPLRSFPILPQPSAQKRVIMSESMSMGAMSANHSSRAMIPSGMKFLINGKLFDMHRIDLRSHVGAWEDWEIVNDSDMDHPFHIHGTQFAVLERELAGNKRTEPLRAWYDTVNLKSQETVRLRIMQSQKGIRMFHCHILEHEDLGMMGRLDVV